MQRVQLGRTGIAVSRLGLGCVTFGREIDEAASCAILDAAVERGVNFFDTAEAYGGGQARDYRKKVLGVEDVREATGEHHSSEKILGRWLKARGGRDRVVLQTKVTTNFTRAHLAEALDASLKRLQTDFVDLYLFHSWDPTAPLEEALEALERARQAGKIRAAGCSNFSAAQLRGCLELARTPGRARLEVIQPDYSLVARGVEAELLPLCRAEQIGVATYSPLAAGFLSGKYGPDRGAAPAGSRFDVIPGHADVYFTPANFAVVEKLRALSARTGEPMVRLALAWVLRCPDVASVLIGARTTAHLDNGLAALALELPADVYAEMNGWVGR